MYTATIKKLDPQSGTAGLDHPGLGYLQFSKEDVNDPQLVTDFAHAKGSEVRYDLATDHAGRQKVTNVRRAHKP